MPKFYRKNKKKNNPRYFLKEGIDNDLETLSEEQDESPNGWCFSPDGSITPSTGTRDGKPACRGADDIHRPEQTKALAVTAFKKVQVAEQKKNMDSIMDNFRKFRNEGAGDIGAGGEIPLDQPPLQEKPLPPAAMKQSTPEIGALKASFAAAKKIETALTKAGIISAMGDSEVQTTVENLKATLMDRLRRLGAEETGDPGATGDF